ncbi:4-coumarate--CoA ligase 3 [Aphelenchoides besseyi]|nr:4-coumarate--CoA ligase 3 [Aphelenchoides besseyi]
MNTLKWQYGFLRRLKSSSFLVIQNESIHIAVSQIRRSEKRSWMKHGKWLNIQQTNYSTMSPVAVEGVPFVHKQLVDAPLEFNDSFPVKFLETLWSHAILEPNRPAIINAHDKSDVVSYTNLYNRSLSVAAFLESRGFSKGSSFCLVLPSCWEFIAAFAGGSYIGGVASGCSMAFKPYELERQFKDSQCKVVFTSSKKLAEVMEAAAKCPLIQLIVVVKQDSSAPSPLPIGLVDFATVLSTAPALRNAPPKIDAANDLLLLPYSSGTTGVPKGVALTHRNFGTMMNSYIWYNQNQIYTTFLKGYNPRKESHLLVMPFYHIYGMGMICSALMEGFTVVVMQQFIPELFCQHLQDYKVKQLYGVPPMFVWLAKSPAVNKYDLSSLVNACTGAAPIGVEVCSELKKRLKMKYVGQGFGMSECSMAAFLPNPHIETFNACGYLCPTLEAKIINPETGETLPPNKRGELCFRGPTVMKGYLNRPLATAETIDRDGWLHSGDIAYFDTFGQVYIVDRIKELIKVKGYQVPPAELEDLLLGHPKINDVAVIGVPDERSGEKPKAFVVRSDTSLNESEVQKFVKDRVAEYKQLTGGVVFVNAIPKNPSGKILRRELREQEKQRSRL